MIRESGAKEVHMRISSPPTTHPCFYGIDTPTRKELIASSHDIDEICNYITADSLNYLTIEEMLDAVPNREQGFCKACFSGDYPIPFTDSQKNQLQLFE